MLAAVLEEEVNAFLGRHRYQRGQTFRGYRNGYHPARELTVGLGPVAVRVPRVAQVPGEVAPQGFHSGVVRRYQRASQTTQRLFARLYPEGLATSFGSGLTRHRTPALLEPPGAKRAEQAAQTAAG